MARVNNLNYKMLHTKMNERLHGKNDFVEKSKILAAYRSEK